MNIGSISDSYQPYSGYAFASSQATDSAASGSTTDSQKTSDSKSTGNVKPGYKSTPAECQTCKERKYQDGSNESDVSFKAPGHISPQASAATVMAHEMQHVSNAYQKASKGNGQVESATVSLHTAICPECGTAYVSGGETSTSISYPNESNPYQQNKKSADAAMLIGSNINYVA